MTYLLRGSVAMDEIQIHHGLFETHILPEHLARLNISFEIHESHDEFGGNAGNIAYTAGLLGDAPIVNASIGALDGQALLERLTECGANTDSMLVVPGLKSARVTMLADQANNQISTFQAGALTHYTPLPPQLPRLTHLSPEMATNMARAVGELIERQAPYFLDPGQSLCNLLHGEGGDAISFETMLWNCSGLFVNDYEAALISERLNMPLTDMVKRIPFIVRTLGSKGCELITHQEITLISACDPVQVKDPTGCGDAFRGGFIHAYLQNLPLVACCQLGSVMGSFAIEHAGGQNHNPTVHDIVMRFEKHFGPYPTGLTVSSSKKNKPS